MRLLARAAGARGISWGSGGGHLGAKVLPGVTCPSDLPLYVRRRGSADVLARVGVVRAKAHVALAPPSADPFRALRGDQKARPDERGTLALREGYELVVDRERTKASALE